MTQSTTPENQEIAQRATSEDRSAGLSDELEDVIERKVQGKINQLLDRYPFVEDADLWTTQQVAEYFSISPRTLDKIVASGDLSPVQKRPRRLFKKRAIDAYLRANTQH